MAEAKKRGRPPSGKPKKELRAIRLEPEFEEELVRAAFWSRISVNAILERGAAMYLKKLEKQHNHGKPFPPVEEV